MAAAETCAYIGVALFTFNLWRDESPKGPAPPPRQLAECVAAGERPLRVDVFFPTASEDLELVRLSLRDAKRLRYPCPIDIRIHVLDDGRRADIRQLAADEGVRYITRKNNADRKAGNLRNAMEKSDGDFVVLCDAGTRLFPRFLEHTLGYFRDRDMAWVQTPQWFFDLPAGDPFGNDPQMLYDVVLRRRNQANAAYCCGAASVHRREAVMQAALKGWVLQVDAELHRVTAKAGAEPDDGLEETMRRQIALDTELTPYRLHVAQDVYTSIVLHSDPDRRWKSVLHPWVQSKMLSSHGLQARLTQRFKHTAGILDICLHENPLFRRGLDWRQKLMYAATFWPCFGGLWNLVFLCAPIIYLFTGIAPVASYSFDFFKHALPFLIAHELALMAGTWGVVSFKAKRSSLAFFAVDLRALWTVLRGAAIEQPGIPGERRSGTFYRLVWPQVLLIVLTLAGLLVQGGSLLSRRGDPGAYLANFSWGLYNIYMLSGLVRAAGRAAE